MSAEPLSEETMLEQALTFGSKEARMSYLQGACGSDESLRARVESLIEAHEAAGGFLKNRRSGLDGVVPTVLVPVTEKPGDRIGRYKLLQQIGEGGCGVVYMAEQEEPVHRRVAFKILKLGMETKSVIARFEAERQALALMDHPNIAKVLDAGATETGRPYFVMELVRGIKITEYCDQNNLSIRERLDLFIQVCHAIQHAHQKGIIHRDIKPSNILVTVNDGVPMPKVIDFGIAKATEQRLTDQTLFTAFEQFIGTPAYMSPEQAGMTSLDIDTRSDVYALGVLLYELLTGKTPFDPKTLLAAGLDEMRRTIREQEPVRPSTRLHTLPGEELTTSAQRRGTEAPKLIYSVRGDLDWIVMKCLEKDRTRRYETANGLAMDIERHLTHEPVVACPPSTAYRARKFIRRNQLMVTAAVLVAGVLVLGIVLSTWQTVRATRAEGKAEEALQHELAERQKALQAQAGEAAQRKVAEDRAEESRQRLVQVNVANGVRLMNEGQLFASLPWLVEALRLEEGRPEGEDLQRRRLGAVLEQCPQLTQIWFHDSPVKCVAFSPDGRRVATGTGRIVQFLIDKGTPGQAQVWDVETGEQVGQPLIHGSSISQLLFSPDGRWIATASADGTARVWDANSGEPVTPPLKHSNSVVCLTFSRDGSLLATASHDKTAQVWEARNGRSVTPSLPHLDVVWGVDFSPDATRLATVSSDGILRLWDTKSGACLFTRREHTSEILGGVQWSPDGSRWITASRDMTARLWDANKGEVLATLRHDEEVWRAAFSPDGWRVVTASVDGTARVWEVKTGAALTFRHGDWVHYAEFSPDGLMVATASRDRTARVWDAMTGRPLTPPLHHGGEVWQAVFSPDGHHLATVSYDGTARVWDLATGGSLVQFTHRLPVTRAALSPEQRRVLTTSADGTTQLWDSDSGEPVGPPIVHLRGVSEALFSPDGRRLLTASYDRTARVWEAGAGNPLTPPMWHQEGVVHTAFSPDGRCVATASTDKTAAVWDAATGRRITPFLVHEREVQWVAFSPDAQRLVTASRDRLARVWDVTTGHELLRLMGHKDWVLRAVFNSNGSQILTASTDKTARLWDAATGEPRAEFRHGDFVVVAEFSPARDRIVTASYDGTARVWDVDNGEAVTPPLRHDNRVEQAAFSSDGRWVVTAGWDETVRLWSAITGDPIAPPIRLAERVRDARLSADGQRVVAASESMAQLWNLSKEVRPVADLVLLAQLLTGQAIDVKGRVSPLDAQAVKQVWQTLKTKSAELRAAARTDARAWHRQALTQALKQQQGFAARWHADHLLKLVPDDDSLSQLRARLESKEAASAASAWIVPDPFAEARSRIPPQQAGTSEQVIDLSDYYTQSVEEGDVGDWNRWREFNNDSGLARGVQMLAEVKFDLRGRVWLQGIQAKGTGFVLPDRISGIKVGRFCRRLHFLHGTGWSETEGKEIARYVMHLANGQQRDRVVRYGNDVQNAWLRVGDPPEHKDAVRAWVGTNALTGETGISFRYYKSVWENPRPDVPVKTIDFISTMSDCAPFLIAITAE